MGGTPGKKIDDWKRNRIRRLLEQKFPRRKIAEAAEVAKRTVDKYAKQLRPATPDGKVAQSDG